MYNFSVDCNAIDISNIGDAHKYLLEKHDMI